MKKLFLLAATLSLCLLFLASCNPPETPNDNIIQETDGTLETEQSGDTEQPGKHIRDLTEELKAKAYKWVEFDLPEDLRQAAVDYMYEQASVEWVCSESFGVKEEWEHWGINLDFKKGVKYTGQPYANSQVNVALFKRAMKDGTYTSPSTSWDDVHGSQCISSILNAYQQSFIIDGWGYSIHPGSEIFQGIKLGSYKVEQRPVDQEIYTSEVCKTNGKDVMYESYSLLQKGDTIFTSDDWTHARMVVEVSVNKNAAGVINPNRSIVKCIEQTNTFDTSRSDVKTTWWVDKTYTFATLFEDGYLPSTYEALQTGISHIPYITLDSENKPNTLAKNTLAGNIRSNYPLRYVVLEVFDRNGNIAKEYTIRGLMTDYAYGLRKYSFNLFGDGLGKGDYTFVLTAGLAIGEYEFERIDFTVE